MEIEFIGRDLRALCNSKAALVQRWGPERGALIAQRLAGLHALDRMSDLEHLAHIEVEEGADATAVYAGADVAIIAESKGSGRRPAQEKLTVLAVEERGEKH